MHVWNKHIFLSKQKDTALFLVMLALNIKSNYFITGRVMQCLLILVGLGVVFWESAIFYFFIRGKHICYWWHVVHTSHDIVLNNAKNVMSYHIK